MTDTNKGCKITLYWLEESRAHRILWLLEELQLTYTLKVYHRGPDKLAPAELKKIHPLGKSPLLSIEAPDASAPLVLAESGVIAEYLLDHFGGERLVPERYGAGKKDVVGGERDEWMRYRYYMHYNEGTLMPLLVMKVIVNSIRTTPPFFVRPLTGLVASGVESGFLNRNLDANFDFLEEQLRTAPGGGPFLTGRDLTAADIMMSMPVIAGVSRVLAGQKDKYPLLVQYAEKLQECDGYKKAVEKIVEVEGHFKAVL